jgi:EAL domain-containing protein (putative c-di-GMP-specific phosphodiesterase class I)
LGLDLIAEGVETQAQLDFLIRHGCDSYQGHLFCKALPIEELDVFIAAQRQKDGR